MVRYQSKQDIRKNLSKTKSQLRTNTNTALKSKRILKTRTKLKRKLLVYKKDGKFYIDNSAAYALKISNVRAIMTENPHLVEIDLEKLYRFQSDENIEIEYQELNKEKEEITQEGDLTKVLGKLEQGEYGIGIHGIDQGDSEKKQMIADSINSEGININNNSKTILSTAVSLGTNENIEQISQEIMEYKFGNGEKGNVIIAVPLYIQNKDGERIFLGFPDENKRTAGQQYEEHCILDRICAKLKKIPPEFILGYYSENPDGSKNFTRNEKNYSNMDLEERESFFTEISSNMDDIAKNCNALISNGDVEKLNKIKEKMQQLGFGSYMIDNAMALSNKYRTEKNKNVRQVILNTDEEGRKESTQKDKKVRRIVLDDKPKDENETNTTKGKITRKVLLDVYSKTNLSEITDIREKLNEELEKQEKDNEKKDSEEQEI